MNQPVYIFDVDSVIDDIQTCTADTLANGTRRRELQEKIGLNGGDIHKTGVV